MEKIKKVLIIIVLIACICIFTGSRESYVFQVYKLNNYTAEENFQLILDEYEQYIDICEKFNIEKKYDASYFDSNSLVFFHIKSSSSSYEYSVENVVFEDNKYIVTIEKNVPIFYENMMKNFVLLLEETDEVTSSIEDIVVEEDVKKQLINFSD